jgi:E3 ubiquitin-protein ligase SHPRH
MATHAPSLRVCVYTGWKGLLESVMKRTNKDRKSKEVKDVAKRKRENDRARARNVQKYQRGNVGARVKVEPDYEEDDSEDSDSEELGVDEDSLQHRTQKLFVEYVQAHDVVITTYK